MPAAGTAAMRAERAAYRALLRLCRAADRQPAWLVGLLGLPPRRYDPRQGRVVRMRTGSSSFLEDTIAAAAGGSTEFAHPVPPAEAGSTGAAARAVRQHFCRARALGLAYVPEARQLARRFEAARRLADEVGAPSMAAAGAGTAGSAGAASSAASSATSSAATEAPRLVLRRFAPCSSCSPAAGDLLLTHPLSCLFSSVFDQAVLLLHEVDATGAVNGLVLNKPTGATLGQMLERWQVRADRQWVDSLDLGPLLQGRLYRGGPVIQGGSLQQSLRWLHVHGQGVRGAREVAPSVWLGGDLEEVAARAGRDPMALRVRFFVGFAGWAPVQLRTELETGVWVRARALPPGDLGAAGEAGLREFCFGSAERGAAWRTAMRGAGMAALAGFPRTPGTDKRLRGYIERLHSEAAEGAAGAEADAAGEAQAPAAASRCGRSDP